MSILNLSEVSRQFQLNRSTIYKAIKAGRLSRRADGNFDLVEIIRCFGEPSGQQLLNPDIQSGSTYKATQVDTEVVAQNKYNLNKENQNLNSIKEESEKMECSQNMLPKHVDSQQKTTVAIPQVNVAQKHERKRGLFGRIVQAVFDAD